MGGDMDYPPPSVSRFGEPLKFLPVIFVWCTILALWTIYVFQHCVPLLQIGERPDLLDESDRERGIIHLVIFNILTGLLVTCYARSILAHPGTIPENDPAWEYWPQDPQAVMDIALQETKKTGDRRHCKWCGKYKPDRCHHCRVCKMCILKMDHHCPWLYNCVGFYNYKFFFLFLLYSSLDLLFIMFTMPESVMRAINEDVTFFSMFVVIFGETLASFMGVLVTGFFGFHVWLMTKAMTTIEFCEKSLRSDSEGVKAYDSSSYDLGVIGNTQAVLGVNMLTWLLPIGEPVGNGLNFFNERTRLAKPMEGTRGLRRKTHQRIQRRTPMSGDEGYDNIESDGFDTSAPFSGQVVTEDDSAGRMT